MKTADDGQVIGIDVAKGWLDVAVLQTAAYWSRPAQKQFFQ